MPNLSLMIMNIIQENINAQFITDDHKYYLATYQCQIYENYPTIEGPPPLPSPLWVMMTNKGAPSFLYNRENVNQQ